MKISLVKKQLSVSKGITFILPDGSLVPENFHITEVGIVSKSFIDCGGTLRHEKLASFQLYNASDFEHRLQPEKLLHIIELSERVLGMDDLEVEVEYQGDTIGKYLLDHNGKDFVLVATTTTCLAKDKCGIPDNKEKRTLQSLTVSNEVCCTPGGGCC